MPGLRTSEYPQQAQPLERGGGRAFRLVSCVADPCCGGTLVWPQETNVARNWGNLRHGGAFESLREPVNL